MTAEIAGRLVFANHVAVSSCTGCDAFGAVFTAHFTVTRRTHEGADIVIAAHLHRASTPASGRTSFCTRTRRPSRSVRPTRSTGSPGTSDAGSSHAGSSHAGASHAGSSHAGASHAGASHAGTSHAGTSHARASHSGTSRAGVSVIVGIVPVAPEGNQDGRQTYSEQVVQDANGHARASFRELPSAKAFIVPKANGRTAIQFGPMPQLRRHPRVGPSSSTMLSISRKATSGRDRVSTEVPEPNNTLYPDPGDPNADVLSMFNEFPAFPRIAQQMDAIATRGNHLPVWTYVTGVDPTTGEEIETRVGTTGIYANVGATDPTLSPLVTATNLLGEAPGFELFSVPDAPAETRFDVFPGAPAITDASHRIQGQLQRAGSVAAHALPARRRGPRRSYRRTGPAMD